MRQRQKYIEITTKRKMIFRFVAMIIDSLIIITSMLIFSFVFGQKILISMLFSALIALGVNVFSVFLFPNNQSLGLKVSRLGVCDFYGGEVSIGKSLFRAVFISFYWVPFFNGMLILTNIISLILYKDKYCHDFFTKTRIESTKSVFYNEKG